MNWKAISVGMGLAVLPHLGSAAQLSLLNTPLFIGGGVQANVHFVMSDKFMDYEVLAVSHRIYADTADPTNDVFTLVSVPVEGPRSLDARNLPSGGRISTTINFRSHHISYLYNTADNETAHADMSPTLVADKVFSPHMYCACVNTLAYDPSKTYEPWPGFRDANIAAVKSNPVPGTPGFSLTENFNTNTAIREYAVLSDSPPAGCVDNDDTRVSPCEVDMVTASNDELQNFANWYQYHRRRSFALRATIAAVVEANPGIRYGVGMGDKVLIEASEDTSVEDSSITNPLVTELLNFNDYVAGSERDEKEVAHRALDAAGQYFQGNGTGHASGSADASPVSPISLRCQQNFSMLLVPSLLGLAVDGFQSSGVTTQFFQTRDLSLASFNVDRDGDGFSKTLADIAQFYYDTDLDGDSTNNAVFTNDADPAEHQHMVTFAVSFGLQNELVDNQLADGSPGQDDIPDGNSLGSTGNLAGNDVWGRVENLAGGFFATGGLFVATDADDVWHATFNSKGEFLFAADAEEIAQSLNAHLVEIGIRAGSAASVALSSPTLTDGSLIFQARFDTEDNSGQLRAFSINGAGDIGSLQWEAGCAISQQEFDQDTGLCTGTRNISEREILTHSELNDRGIAFVFDDLDADQQASLNVNPLSGTADGRGEERLSYLRGASATDANGFRPRKTLLGDIINSAPVLVPPPFRQFPDNLENDPYSAFVLNQQARPPVVAIGANDGMFHLFRGDAAGDGEELFAYVPSKVIPRLPILTDKLYSHRPYVDGEIGEMDAYIQPASGGGKAWRTVLVGSLRHGGQGVYALDITSPTSITENNAANVVLWEYTDEDDADLGFVYGQPQIVRMPDGTWVAAVGNGYNNSRDDDEDGDNDGTDACDDRNDPEPCTVSATGTASLILIDLETGELHSKLDTGSGSVGTPNGLHAPFAVDLDGDFDVDRFYAGDLLGNVWRFDTDSDNKNQWSVGLGGVPLFAANAVTRPEQAITSQPVVTAHPDGLPGVMVYFGTGKLIESSDAGAEGKTTQNFFAVWDKNVNDNDTVVLPAVNDLVTQSVIFQSDSFRATSNNTVDYGDGDLGWRLELEDTDDVNNGERVISRSVVIGDSVFFTTFFPPVDECSQGGDAFIMVLGARDGGPPTQSIFDVNNDGVTSVDDQIALGDDVFVVASGASTGGLTATPTIAQTADKQFNALILSGTGSDSPTTLRFAKQGGALGREFWRQLQ